MNFFKRIFRKDQGSIPECSTPEMPENWNLTIDDLFEEMKAGKRKTIEPPEGDWARAYQLKQIPPETRFPEKGDVYESLEDQTVDYLTAWSAPYTGGGKESLLKGEKVWIHSDPADDKPLGVYALPFRL